MARLNDIKTAIGTAISGITVLNGYTYNWGSVNEFDDAQKTFPAADIVFVGEVADSSPVNSQYGIATASFDIDITCKLTTTDEYPVNTVDAEIIAKLHDVKSKLLTAWDGQLALTGTYVVIHYKGSEKITSTAGDRFVPGKLRTHWAVDYSDA